MKHNLEKSVAVFGGTGLIGNYLINTLIQDQSVSKINVFTRRPLRFTHYQVEEHIVDFDHLAQITSSLHDTDIVYCSLGTTMKKAGSVKNFREIDQDLIIRIAKVVKEAGVKRFVYISSIGANSESKNYYLRSKGETENRMKEVGFESIVIFRPSFLLGQRDETRILEYIAKNVYRIVGYLMVGGLRKYRPIHGSVVARAMTRLSYILYPKEIYESDEIEVLGQEDGPDLL